MRVITDKTKLAEEYSAFTDAEFMSFKYLMLILSIANRKAETIFAIIPSI